MSEQRMAFSQPADGWILMLWTQGVGLWLFSIMAETFATPCWYPCAIIGTVSGITALFFVAALPSSDATVQEGIFARLALGFFRLLPRGRLARGAALLAALLPAWGDLSSAAGLWTHGLVAAMMLGSVLRTQETSPEPADWDRVAPFFMTGIAAAYGLSASFYPPFDLDRAAKGLALAWLAQALLLRQAAARQWAAVAIVARREKGVPAVQVPLDDYLSETEKLAAAVVAPVAGPDGVLHVGSGTFRVDAARMIEKLSERQLAEAGDFILAWIRCAVASGAGRIRLDLAPSLLRVRFDGKPFTEAQLRDPYRALLDSEAEDAVRCAQFAYGLLAVLRLEPGSIWILSGKGQTRARTMLASRSAKGEAPPDDLDSDTLIEVRFRLEGLAHPFLAGWRALRAYGLADARLTVWGWDADPFPAAKGWTTAEKGGWRFALKPRHGEVSSRIRVYHLGALVEELEQPTDLRLEVDGAMTHDELRLSLSQASAVRDERFAAGIRLLQAAALENPGLGAAS